MSWVWKWRVATSKYNHTHSEVDSPIQSSWNIRMSLNHTCVCAYMHARAHRISIVVKGAGACSAGSWKLTSDVVSRGIRFLSDRPFPRWNSLSPVKLSTSIGGEFHRWSYPPFHRWTFPRLPFRPDVSPVKTKFHRWSLSGEEFGLKGLLVG